MITLLRASGKECAGSCVVLYFGAFLEIQALDVNGMRGSEVY